MDVEPTEKPTAKAIVAVVTALVAMALGVMVHDQVVMDVHVEVKPADGTDCQPGDSITPDDTCKEETQ